MKKETQDNAREQQIIEHCGLMPHKSRIAEDANDVFGNPFEIKTVTKNKGVSTARQVHLRKVAKWRSWYWIFAKGPITNDGMILEEMYIAHPDDLEPFFSKCESKIKDKLEKCEDVLEQVSELSQELLEEVHAIMEVGTRLDDPSIPLKLVRSCRPLLTDDAKLCQSIVNEFVQDRPLHRLDA